MTISGNQGPSEAISGNQRRAWARRPSEAISSNQWQSVARLGEEAGGFEQAEAVVVHGVLIEDEEDEHVPDVQGLPN